MVEKFTAANSDPEIKDIYYEMFDVWNNESGSELFMYYSYVRKNTGYDSNKYGTWGALEYLDQPIEDAPKYAALVDVMGECGNGVCSSGEDCSSCGEDCVSIHEADNDPCDGRIDEDELLDHISRWKRGDAGMVSLLSAIWIWKYGS